MAWIFLLSTGVTAAQPLPPNDAGVSFQNFEFHEGTPQAAFWAAVVGTPQGVLMTGAFSLLTFPDSRFNVALVSKKPTGGTTGSVVDHIGLRLKNLSGTLARVRAGGFKIEQDDESKQMFLYGPDDLKVEND